MYSKLSLLLVLPDGGGSGLNISSVMRNGGVSVTKVATVGPDQELEMGGLLAPVKFRWLAFQLRAKTRALALNVILAMLVAEYAPGRSPPPGSRGSVPSSV